jgi:hypothetical protein
VREPSSRTLDQWIALRFPVLVGGYARLLGRLPHSTRLRHALLSRGARLTAEALNRRDVDAVVRGYRADYEFHPPHDLGTRVVTLYIVPTRGQVSGVRLTGKWATVSTLKHGSVVRDRVYLDHSEALNAVGLRG